MEDHEGPTLSIESAKRSSKIDELGRRDGRCREHHGFELHFTSAKLPPLVIQESPEKDPSGPCRDRSRLLELAQPLVHSAQGVTDQDICLGRAGRERARKWEQLAGEAFDEATDGVLVPSQSGFSQ